MKDAIHWPRRERRFYLLVLLLCATQRDKMNLDKSWRERCSSTKNAFSCSFKTSTNSHCFLQCSSTSLRTLIRRESPSTDCVETKMDSFSPSTHRGYGNDKSWGVPIFMTQTRGTHFVSGVEIEGKIRNFVFSGLNLRLSFPWSD